MVTRAGVAGPHLLHRVTAQATAPRLHQDRSRFHLDTATAVLGTLRPARPDAHDAIHWASLLAAPSLPFHRRALHAIGIRRDNNVTLDRFPATALVRIPPLAAIIANNTLTQAVQALACLRRPVRKVTVGDIGGWCESTVSQDFIPHPPNGAYP